MVERHFASNNQFQILQIVLVGQSEMTLFQRNESMQNFTCQKSFSLNKNILVVFTS